MKQAQKRNPAGQEGKPISLYPLKPAEAIKGLMMVKPEPKRAKKTTPKKTARKK